MTSALSNLDFWVEPRALAAFLVAIHHITAGAYALEKAIGKSFWEIRGTRFAKAESSLLHPGTDQNQLMENWHGRGLGLGGDCSILHRRGVGHVAQLERESLVALDDGPGKNDKETCPF